MPWPTGKSFAQKHNHSLKGAAANKAARIATAMVNRGVPEGEAIATANARAKKKQPQKDGLRKHAQIIAKGMI